MLHTVHCPLMWRCRGAVHDTALAFTLVLEPEVSARHPIFLACVCVSCDLQRIKTLQRAGMVTAMSVELSEVLLLEHRRGCSALCCNSGCLVYNSLSALLLKAVVRERAHLVLTYPGTGGRREPVIWFPQFRWMCVIAYAVHSHLYMCWTCVVSCKMM